MRLGEKSANKKHMCSSILLCLANIEEICFARKSTCISAQSCREKLILKLWQYSQLIWGRKEGAREPRERERKDSAFQPDLTPGSHEKR